MSKNKLSEDVITPDEVFSAFLYCNGTFVWGGSA